MVKLRTMKTPLILFGLLLILPFGRTMAKEESLPLMVHIVPETSSSDTNRYNNLLIRPFQLEIVPPSSGVQFYKDGIIFLSHSKIEEKIPERHVSFGSVRTYHSVIADTIPGQYMTFNIDRPALFPSEATTFANDYNTMYLSLIPEGSSSEKIFKASYSQTGWKIDYDPLAICFGNYIYSHPSLSADGTFMVFSSDMLGSTGGLDLFITRKEENGWSKPQNIGKDINSPGNELFASLDSRNNLYFSSDGKPGQGGYDIYLCRYNGSYWEKPHSLTETVNTKDDELAFAINRVDDKTAFFTRRARSGRYRTQLYIMDANQVKGANSILNLSAFFLGNAKSEYTASEPVEPDGLTIVAESQLRKNMRSEKTGNINDTVRMKPESPATEIKKEAAASVKLSQTVSTAEAKKEDTPAARQAQPSPGKAIEKDEIVYRVQITANTKPVGSQNITVAGKSYKSFEYLYMGGYRTTIGAFSSLSEAARLQAICRQNGYTQAFVVAFKNNIRSNDPALFK